MHGCVNVQGSKLPTMKSELKQTFSILYPKISEFHSINAAPCNIVNACRERESEITMMTHAERP